MLESYSTQTARQKRRYSNTAVRFPIVIRREPFIHRALTVNSLAERGRWRAHAYAGATPVGFALKSLCHHIKITQNEN